MPSDVTPGNIQPMGSDRGKSVGGVTNTIALGRLGWRLFGSKNDRSSGKPTTADDAYFENLAELDRHRSQLRMTEAANAANIRDMELSRSAGHLHKRISAVRDASVIIDQGRRVGEIDVDDKALGIRTGGYRLPDRPAQDLGDDEGSSQTPVEELFSGPASRTQEFSVGRKAPEHEGTEVPFTKASVHANDKQAEQNRIDASYGLGEKSMTDIGHEAGAPARLGEWVDATYGNEE